MTCRTCGIHEYPPNGGIGGIGSKVVDEKMARMRKADLELRVTYYYSSIRCIYCILQRWRRWWWYSILFLITVHNAEIALRRQGGPSVVSVQALLFLFSWKQYRNVFRPNACFFDMSEKWRRQKIDMNWVHFCLQYLINVAKVCVLPLHSQAGASTTSWFQETQNGIDVLPLSAINTYGAVSIWDYRYNYRWEMCNQRTIAFDSVRPVHTSTDAKR